jgi:hypothetical protein
MNTIIERLRYRLSKYEIEELEKLVAERDALASRIELLEHDMKSGTYETLYAQVVVECQALAAQVVAMREALNAIDKCRDLALPGYIHYGIAKTLALDTSAAETLLRERDARVIEECKAKVLGGAFLTDSSPEMMMAQAIGRMFDRMADERRAGK